MNSEYSGPNRPSILDQWRNYKFNGSSPSSVYTTAKNSKYLVKRLSIHEEIPGHNGCVNTVHWNKTGTILLSGSDDRHLNLYSYPSFRMVERIKSGHRANIFNAKFIPFSNDTKICSCSGDGIMHYNNMMDKKNYGKNPFKCHVGIVYDVIVHNQDPNGFLSCGEDGTVRYFDLRTTSSCNCSHCNKNTLIDIKQPITSCALNPFNPNEIVVGCDDSTVRAYDRRFRFTQESKRITQIGRPQSNSYPPIDPKETGLIYAYRPSSSTLDSNSGSTHYNNRLTCVTFNWKGDEILASFCPSLLTVFSTVPKSNPTQAESDDIRSNLFDECFLFPGGIMPESSKPTKRLSPYVEKNETNDEDDHSSPHSQHSGDNIDKSESNSADEEAIVNDDNNHHDGSSSRAGASSPYQSPLSQATNLNPQSPRTNDNDDWSPTDPHRSIYDENILRVSLERENQQLYLQSNPNSNQMSENDSYNLSNLQQDSRTLRAHDRTSSTTVTSAPNVPIRVYATSNETHTDNNNSAALLLSDNTHQHASAAHSRSLDTDTHSNRTAPLPRTRGVVSSDIYSNYNQNNSEANTRSEFTGTISTSTQHSHQTGSAPFIDPRSAPTGCPRNELSKKRLKTPHSRYSAWDCASSGYSKTCVSDTTAIGTNLSDTNPQIEMDYNPTFFNSIDSLTTVGEHDRLRAYIDNLFVPSYVFNYKGHHNTRTMIKECNFYGDDYVMSGSDDGNVFIWDKWTCQLVNVFNADNNVVNCLQPHPIDPVIACSGIDATIKIVAPVRKAAVPVRDINTIIESNERELRGTNSYYFDATPTMIFHVLLALERIQRNRAEDTTPQTDPSNPDTTQDVDQERATREGFQRNIRGRNLTLPNLRRARLPTVDPNSSDDSIDPNSQGADLDSFFESDVYDDEDQEYSFDSIATSRSHSSSFDDIEE